MTQRPVIPKVTDTSEKGLETLIVVHLTGTDGLSVPPSTLATTPETGCGYFAGCPRDYDRAHALDVPQLFAFLRATQPDAFKKIGILDGHAHTDINRLKFLTRLSAEIGKRGVIDVLRKGLAHGPLSFDLFYGMPSAGNAKAEELHAKNRFSITRQLAYRMDETRRALDLGLFINGLPIATFELKNSLTKQTVEDAVQQYERDRDPRERLCRTLRVSRERGVPADRPGLGLYLDEPLTRSIVNPAESALIFCSNGESVLDSRTRQT